MGGVVGWGVGDVFPGYIEYGDLRFSNARLVLVSLLSATLPIPASHIRRVSVFLLGTPLTTLGGDRDIFIGWGVWGRFASPSPGVSLFLYCVHNLDHIGRVSATLIVLACFLFIC